MRKVDLNRVMYSGETPFSLADEWYLMYVYDASDPRQAEAAALYKNSKLRICVIDKCELKEQDEFSLPAFIAMVPDPYAFEGDEAYQFINMKEDDIVVNGVNVGEFIASEEREMDWQKYLRDRSE